MQEIDQNLNKNMFFLLYKYASILNLRVFIFLDVDDDDDDDDDDVDDDNGDDDDNYDADADYDAADDDFIIQHYLMSHTFDKIYFISLKLLTG